MQLQKHSDLESYLDSVYVLSHSYNTVISYKGGVLKFRNFVKSKYQITDLELVDEIKNERCDVYQIFKDFVVYLDKLEYSPQTIKLTLAAVKGYLRHLGVKVYSEDLKQEVRIPKKSIVREEAVTKEMLVRLLHKAPAKLQAAILVATSSGMRVGELVQIRVSDIDFDLKPTKIRVRAEITKTREARETFLTQEATVALKDYLKHYFDWKEGRNNDTLRNIAIFGRTSKIIKEFIRKPDRKSPPYMTAVNCLDQSLKRTIKKIPEFDRKNENSRSLVHFHSFRKFFRTMASEAVGRDYAEALMGHHFYLDTYYTLSEERKSEMYEKAEPYLTISDFTKIEKTLKGISEKQEELEAKVARLEKNAIQVPDFLE